MSNEKISSPSPISNRSWLVAVLAMIGAAASWGFATVMSRDLVATVSPTVLLTIQLIGSVAILTLISQFQKSQRPVSAGLWRAALIGIFEPGLTFLVALVGLSYTGAGRAAIIGGTEPVLIIIVGWVLFAEQPTKRLIIAIAIALAGLMLVSSDAWSHAETVSLFGDALILLATFFAAIYVVLSARIAGNFNATILALSQQVCALMFALIILSIGYGFGFEKQSLSLLSLPTIFYAALSGIVQYALAFWLYLTGLKHMRAGEAGLWLALIPVFGLFGAFVWLKEAPTLAMLAGVALIISAVIFRWAGNPNLDASKVYTT